MIVCSDHSQSKVEAEIDLFAAFDGFDVAPADGAQGGGARDRAVPGLALGAGLPPRPRRRRRAARARRRAPRWRWRASTSSCTAPTTRTARRSCAPAAASCASGPAATSPTCAASAGASTATSPRSSSDDRRRHRPLRDLPGRARAVWVGAALPPVRRSCCCRAKPGLRVHRLGRRRPRRRRLARLAARQRLARRAAVGRWDLPAADASAAVVAARHHADGARPLRGRPR